MLGNTKWNVRFALAVAGLCQTTADPAGIFLSRPGLANVLERSWGGNKVAPGGIWIGGNRKASTEEGGQGAAENPGNRVKECL